MWYNKLKKTVFTLNVDNYAPEITELTYPLLRRYAQKIGADFHMITERKFPGFPPVYEKLQIHKLGQKMKNDWNIYVDSDALIHPDFFDVTEFLTKDTVCHNGSDMANNRWRYDKYFRRDGRNIGSCNWLTIASDWCLDLWQPLEIPFEEALENIFPIQNELNTVVTKEHLIDDYTLSRNIARFGLKFKTIAQIMNDIRDGGTYLWHQYTIPVPDKVKDMRRILANWCISEYKNPAIDDPFTSYSELIWLYLNAKKAGSVVIVGAGRGSCIHALASACTGKVYVVDDFKKTPKEFPDMEQKLRRDFAKFKHVEFLTMKSHEAALKFSDSSADMVLLEMPTDRDDVHKNIDIWYPKCRTLLCGRNFDHDDVKLGIFDSNLIPRMEVGNIWSADSIKLKNIEG